MALAAVTASGCKADVTSEPETVSVIFEVNGTGSTLAAAADGDSIKSKGRVEKGKTAIFTAVPQSGYLPNAWTITGGKILAGGKQGDTSATVKLTSDITSIVSFKPLPPSLHTVTATHGAHGSLTAAPAPVGGKAAKDTEMTFTATPDSGYKVDMWFVSGGEILSGGNDEEASVTVKISANTRVRVTFKAEEAASPATEYFTAAMTHGEHGRVSASPKIPADGKIAKDTEMTFSAKPETGYCVEKWTITGGTFIAGTGTDGSATAKVKIAADTAVRVTFKKLPEGMYAAAMGHGEHGLIAAEPAIPASGVVAKDTEMTFTATPDSGYKVDMWFVSGGEILSGGNDEEASVTVKISANTTVRVTFKAASPVPAAEMVAVTMTHGDNGDLTAVPAPVDGKAAKDSEITFIASPKAGYAVDAWTVTPAAALQADGKAGDLLAKVKITAATTVHVTFKPIAYSVTFSAADAKGTLSATLDGESFTGGNVPFGKSVLFTANPIYGYQADMWIIAGGEIQSGGQTGGTSAKIKITADTTVRVTFKPITYSVTFDAQGGSPVPQMQPIPYGGKVTEPAEPPVKANHVFKGWHNQNGDARWNFAADTVTNNTVLYAKWELNKYEVTFTVDGGNGRLNAALNGSPFTGGKVEHGQTIEFTAHPNDGYEIGAWTVSGGVFENNTGKYGDATATVKITAATTVTVKMNPTWITVPFDDLDNYLKNTASDSRVNRIEVTELKLEHLKGLKQTSGYEASELGWILRKHPKKKVALQLFTPVTSADIDMTGCFAGCTNLTQVLKLSSYDNNIKYMDGCFYGCTNLTYVPPIPLFVHRMIECFRDCAKLTSLELRCSTYYLDIFKDTFKGCSGFKAKSIKVRSNSLQKFKDDASHMGAQADWFFSGN